jgi:hypothetical protein
MDIKEVGFENVDWIHLSQDMFQWRILVNKVEPNKLKGP